MIIKKELPRLTVFSPNRKDVLSTVAQPKHAKLQYNFNACSTIEFQVDKRILDTKTGEWIENPCYNDLAENNLIYMANASNVFNYYGCPLLPDGSYQRYALSGQTVRVRNENNFLPYVKQYKPSFHNCTLADEEQLFDVGGQAGYPWKMMFQILTKRDSNNSFTTKGAGYIQQLGSRLRMAIDGFFPVQVGDVVFMGSSTKDGAYTTASGATSTYGYTLFFYSSDSEDSCVKYGQLDTILAQSDTKYSPCARYRIKDGDFGYISYTENGTTKRIARKQGFIRFAGICDGDFIPWAGYTYIISGERKLSHITLGTRANQKHSIPWFVIQDVKEVKDGRGVHKTVKAYSYEYTLSKKNFSVDESTLPLYIPDEIINQINSSQWLIDAWKNTSTANTVSYTLGAQRMRRGIINEILDYLPDWKIGYISSSALALKYRPIEKADNVNIYSYLINHIQKQYGCYVIFNTENMTINLISQDDIFATNAGTAISWRNALKTLDITNQNTKYITAMRVYSESDNYGLSLVNPNGTDVLYNFDSVLDQMDYVVDDTHINPDTNNPYTLKELITKYKATINTNMSTYRNCGKALISATKDMEKYEKLLAASLADYKKVVNENNQKDTNASGLAMTGMPPIPQDLTLFDNGKEYACYYGSGDLSNHYATENNYFLIKAATEAYWVFYQTYSEAVSRIAENTAKMKEMALVVSFNYKTVSAEYATNGNLSRCLFTPTEVKELYKFIFEGDWETHIITFNDDFSTNDIHNALLEIYATANSELTNIYSKPIYEFNSDIADIFRIDELKESASNICLGNSLYIIDGDYWILPILLQVDVDYDSMNGVKMSFSTDYKRKPTKYRFSDMLATIQQTSVQTPKFTFD